MNATVEESTPLNETNRFLARIVATWLHSFWECSNEVQQVVREMFEIVNDKEAEEDEKEMAIATVLEALFPSRYNGALGADLEELERDDKKWCMNQANAIEAMDQEEALFAGQVAKLMAEKNITQEQLAAAIGVGQSAISMMLSRCARPQRRTVVRIAEALGVSPSEIWPGFSAT